MSISTPSDSVISDARSRIHWPEAYEPANAAMYATNELAIPAPPGTVWAWLVYAAGWSDLYANAREVEFVVWPGPNLRAGSVFTWKTFDFQLTSTVHDFESERRLAWIARGEGVMAYHTWLLEPLADGGTLVITDETQISTLGIWGGETFKHGLEEQHDLWLDGLSKKAQAGRPASAEPRTSVDGG